MIYVRFIKLFLLLFCTCAVIAFASPSFGGDDNFEKPGTANQGNVAALKKKIGDKIGPGSSRPLPPTPKKNAPERPQFTNLQQEDRVYGISQNLNLDTLYKLNPELWDEFRGSFPKVPSDVQPSTIQPVFARFIQDYVIVGIYGTNLPALSWYEEAKNFNWRDILLNPQYRDVITSQRQKNRGWFMTDVADWIQRSYITSQQTAAALPWMPTIETTTL